MRQLSFIIMREVLVKLKSKGFYLLPLLSPILFLIPLIFSFFTHQTKDNTIKNTVPIVGLLSPQKLLSDTFYFQNIRFVSISGQYNKEEVQNNLLDTEQYTAIIDMYEVDSDSTHLRPFHLYVHTKYVSAIQKWKKDIEIFANKTYRLTHLSIPLNEKLLLKDTRNFRNLTIVTPKKNNSTNNKEASTVLAYILGMLFYITYILFNNNIANTLNEEKNNKLADILSLFVRPFNLITGKIIGLGFTALLQILLWILCFYLYIQLLLSIELHYFNIEKTQESFFLNTAWESMKNLSLLKLGFFSLLFFCLGILLNGSLMTTLTISSKKGKTNNLTILGNLFNILTIYFAMYAAGSPDNTLIQILSYIPLFSYLLIPTLLPYNISFLQIGISTLLLLATSILLLLWAGKIYKKSLTT